VIILECRDDIGSKRDRNIIKAVPCISLISALSGIILVLIISASGSQELGLIMTVLFSPFVVGYAALGVYSFIYREKGLLKRRITAFILLVIPFIASLLLVAITSYAVPDIVDSLIRHMPSRISKTAAIFLSVYALTAIMMFTSHGVISTVVAYFRVYTARIYLSMENLKNDGTDSRRNKISRWVYDIPNIIDVDRVELDPVPDDEEFPLKLFSSLAFSIFALGLSISSYVFLNPIFQSTFTLEEAVLITIILTFFVPVLVIPWFITRDTGAKIKSRARDYYLWNGMKKRLYQGLFTVVIFLSFFMISMYIGFDLVRTLYTYAGYIILTAFLSMLYAFIYANYYYRGFKKGIVDSFNDAKQS